MSGKYISTELLKKQFDPKTLDPLVKEARRKGYSEQDVNEARARAEEIAKIICDGIDLIPAADVEPVVRGEWQKVYENTTFGAMYRCSVCGETTFNVENYKYCPKCGAHMERSGSDE